MQLKEIRALNAKLDAVADKLKQFEEFAYNTVEQAGNDVEKMANALVKLALLAGKMYEQLGAGGVK
jgi:hypothetical protein